MPSMLNMLQFVNDNVELESMNHHILSQLLLWFDLYDKATRHSRRLQQLQDVAELEWHYLPTDDRYSARGKWVAFSQEANKHISKVSSTQSSTSTKVIF